MLIEYPGFGGGVGEGREQLSREDSGKMKTFVKVSEFN